MTNQHDIIAREILTVGSRSFIRQLQDRFSPRSNVKYQNYDDSSYERNILFLRDYLLFYDQCKLKVINVKISLFISILLVINTILYSIWVLFKIMKPFCFSILTFISFTFRKCLHAIHKPIILVNKFVKFQLDGSICKKVM